MRYFLFILFFLFLSCSQPFINSVKWEVVTRDETYEERQTVQAAYAISKTNFTTSPSGYIRLVDYGKDFKYKDIDKVILYINGGKEKNTAAIELQNQDALCFYNYQELTNKLKEAQIDSVKCYSATLEVHLKNSDATFYSAPAYMALNSELRTLRLIDSCACDTTPPPPPPPPPPAPPTLGSPVPVVEEPSKDNYLCLLDKTFKNKIKLSPNSRVYKIDFKNHQTVGDKIFFETAAFGITNYLEELVDSMRIALKKEGAKQWAENDSVAFIFEGQASAPEIRTDQITANLGMTTFYKWDRTSNCLVEQTAQYNNSRIKNADLPILRACNSADYFASNLNDLISDIQSRIFPVAVDPPPQGNDVQELRVVNIYVIAKPHLAQIKE
ncbi:hypothetical protein JW998_07755 [candidate division KSB1 bacterium]|nr:hypothetical protein [candidate division KSB1 bacterium]